MLSLHKIALPLIGWLNREKPVRNIPLSDYEKIRHEVKPCDVILVEGRTRVSEVIKLITQSRWSHAALYIGRLHDIENVEVREIVKKHCQGNPDQQLIIESELGLGTVIRPLSVYAKEHMRICRASGLAYRDVQHVIRYAVSQLGYEYDVRQIIDLARFFFPWWILPRRWRSSLFSQNPGKTTRTVCSTMIAEAFAYVQFPILPLVKMNVDAKFSKRSNDNEMQIFQRNPRLCTPCDFDYSPYFQVIKYPFVDFRRENDSDYRLLPWHGSGVLAGEEADLYAARFNSNLETHGPAPRKLDEERDAKPQLISSSITAGSVTPEPERS